MWFNNAVYNARQEVVGFRCLQCGSIVQSMWGNYCNQCREDERRHQELIAAISAAAQLQSALSPQDKESK